MIKYEKLETIFSRDMNGTKKLMPGVFRDSTVEFLKDAQWDWTEKVDGTNIGVVWGRRYIPDGVGFILFDLYIGGNYQPRESVARAARSFGIPTVPVVGRGTLDEAVEFVKGHPQSTLGNLPMEGVVCRPTIELRDRCGNRVITKIKWNDFKDLI